MQIKNNEIKLGINNLQKAQSLQPNNFEITVKLGEVIAESIKRHLNEYGSK